MEQHPLPRKSVSGWSKDEVQWLILFQDITQKGIQAQKVCTDQSLGSLEMVALVVPCCHRMILMSLSILYAHLDANKL